MQSQRDDLPITLVRVRRYRIFYVKIKLFEILKVGTNTVSTSTVLVRFGVSLRLTHAHSLQTGGPGATTRVLGRRAPLKHGLRACPSTHCSTGGDSACTQRWRNAGAQPVGGTGRSGAAG